MNTQHAEIAARPMKLFERLKLNCGYERSFKLTENIIQANRYVLGAATNDLAPIRWQEVTDNLGMPASLQELFLNKLASSSTVLVGFDLTSDQQPGYKVYLEFMDARPPVGDLSSASPFLLGIGYKWQVEKPERQLLTHYQCVPGISSQQILSKAATHFDEMKIPTAKDQVMEIIRVASASANGAQLLYLEVSEDDTNRSSFDINLYPSGLTIQAVMPQLDLLSKEFNCPQDRYERLRPLIVDKLLGHISCGTNSAGHPYFSLYYEA